MLQARVEKSTDNQFYITPIGAGGYGIAFKEEWQADRIADAINDAYARGANELRSSLRELLGAAQEEE
jgi:hypothetical protein